jgi:hypothetical protein
MAHLTPSLIDLSVETLYRQQGEFKSGLPSQDALKEVLISPTLTF